jgi:uncharacterized protein YggE
LVVSPTLDRRRAFAAIAGIGAAGIVSGQTVLAQATPEAKSGTTTIVATATGKSEAPATTAIGQLVIRAQYPPMPIDSSTPPVTDNVTPVVTQNDIDVVVGALTEFGIDEDDILTSVNSTGMGSGYFGVGTGVVVFEVRGEAIKNLGKAFAAGTEAAVSQGLTSDPAAVLLLADGCDDLRAAAFKDAVTVARADAELLAIAAGVELGALVQATKVSVNFGPAYTTSQSDSCDALVDPGMALRTYLPPFDISAPNTFSVFATIQLTYASA